MKNLNIYNIIILVISALINYSCEDYLEVDTPKDEIPHSEIFESETTAIAATTSLYANLRDKTLLTGSFGMSMVMGYYSDEFDYHHFPGQPIEAFYNHQILDNNLNVESIWKNSYELIYQCNSVIEGLDSSITLDADFKDPLIGEALFVRSLVYFYLINLFGDVPYITDTDYLLNQSVSRDNTELVYDSIIQDLLNSKAKLSENYISQERVRANKFVVSALLSRVYLYRGEWSKALHEANFVMSSNQYYLEELDLEFLKESKSTILSLKPYPEGENTKEGAMYLFESGTPLYLAINAGFVNSFAPNDLRKEKWINEVVTDNQIYYVPYKYKEKANTGISKEYSIAFRLSEIYLIAAESNAHLGNLNESLIFLNKIRERAGLPPLSSSSQVEIMENIINERKFEFFSEHGHRWFDLKRTGQAADVIGSIKPNWHPKNILLPIPISEILMNPNLLPQNSGY